MKLMQFRQVTALVQHSLKLPAGVSGKGLFLKNQFLLTYIASGLF